MKCPVPSPVRWPLRALEPLTRMGSRGMGQCSQLCLENCLDHLPLWSPCVPGVCPTGCVGTGQQAWGLPQGPLAPENRSERLSLSQRPTARPPVPRQHLGPEPDHPQHRGPDQPGHRLTPPAWMPGSAPVGLWVGGEQAHSSASGARRVGDSSHKLSSKGWGAVEGL